MKPIDLKSLFEFLDDGPVKQILHDSVHLRMALLCMEAGQEVQPHSAPSEVMMQVLEGEGEFTVGDQKMKGSSGAIFPCLPDQPHGIRAITRLAVLAIVTPRPPQKSA
jgi:quercetin dioxygenase-like cupin family protein